MIEQLSCTLCFMSESWERPKNDLKNILEIEDFKIITNVCQREGRGGKPAIIVSEKDYYVKELCPNIITVPKNVEAVWALLTPKLGGCRGKIKHIAVCAYYYTKATSASNFLDHITSAFQTISAKYGEGTQFILSGDSNRLKLNAILNLSPALKQVVNIPTRRNPDATLDTILTTLSSYYHPPCTLPPLDNDSSTSGAPSDHLIVYMRPISADQPRIKETKSVKFRPLPESGIEKFKSWIQTEKWESVYAGKTAHEKAQNLQDLLLTNLDKFLPTKTHKISSDDQPWYSLKLKKLER